MANLTNDIPLMDLTAQYQELKTELDQVVWDTIEDATFIKGDKLARFEAEFAGYIGTKHAIGVSSGTSALLLALEALGVGKGDEIITTPHTFIATAEMASKLGATPVFADIDPETYNLDPKKVEKLITKRTKAIVVVHLYGYPADLKRFKVIAKEHEIALIEDCAQAHGAKYRGKTVGSFSDMACFSFFPAKNLGCFGDGGAVTTSRDDLAGKVHKLRDHGRKSKYEHDILGWGERLDTLQAEVLRVKLTKLDTWNAKRRQIATNYNEAFTSLHPQLITPPSGDSQHEPVYYVYTIQVKDRDQLASYLKKKGIATGIYYPLPLHLQPAYKNLGYGKGDFPVTEKTAKRILSLPMHPHLTDQETDAIIQAVIEYFN